MKPNKRTLTDVRNEIIRTQSNIKAIKSPPFSSEDCDILLPRYTADLERLKNEEKALKSEVVDPIVVKE